MKQKYNVDQYDFTCKYGSCILVSKSRDPPKISKTEKSKKT